MDVILNKNFNKLCTFIKKIGRLLGLSFHTHNMFLMGSSLIRLLKYLVVTFSHRLVHINFKSPIFE